MSFELLSSGKEPRFARVTFNPENNSATVDFGFTTIGEQGDKRMQFYSGEFRNAKLFLGDLQCEFGEHSYGVDHYGDFFSAAFTGFNAVIEEDRLVATCKAVQSLNKKFLKRALSQPPRTYSEYLGLIEKIVGIKDWVYCSQTYRNVFMDKTDMIEKMMRDMKVNSDKEYAA